MNISALDESGNPVDWWFIYKVPQLSKGANSDSATGYEYVYFDPNLANVAKSQNVINQGKGALNLTGHEVGGFRLPMVDPSEQELDAIRGCLERSGVLSTASA